MTVDIKIYDLDYFKWFELLSQGEDIMWSLLQTAVAI